MKRQDVYIYPLDGKVIFPYSEYRFVLKANSYDAQLHENLIGFVTKLDESKDNTAIEKIDGLSKFGTLLRIQKAYTINSSTNADKSKESHTNYVGITFARYRSNDYRFKIISKKQSQGNITANIQIYTDQVTKQIESMLQKKNLIQNLRKELRIYYEVIMKNRDTDSSKDRLDGEVSLNKIIYKTISDLEISSIEKVKFLQMNQLDSKIEILIGFLVDKTEKSKDMAVLQSKVKGEMVQKKKLIRLNSNSEKNQFQNRIKNKKLPENVKLEIEKEMKNVGFGAEKPVIQKYIDTLLDIPWLESTEDVKDISLAEKILQEDHTGLKEVKERILEFLAVKFRNGNSKGNIICLHGPPGVGKTSIAKSIARSLGRSFTRVSLGGLNDEAELRGHRRTYVAALPGAIIRALIKAKANNPVILLDEIEKLGKNYKGNPQHALLQILDPSQNSSFVDHYVSLPVDLSKVMFICTANSLDLSNPLLNRLELIEVPGYSREEKLEIANNHLIPLQIKENGVEGLALFENDGLKEIIQYSNELGVRGLERSISKICRKIARKGTKELVTADKVEEYLGKRHKKQLWNGIGVVNGMAWTEIGGKVLTVEAIQYRSDKHRIEVTGQLGDVMKESVNIAFSWIKSNFEELGASNSVTQVTKIERTKLFEDVSLHIHFPQGATKKDGPSAGVTIITCIASLLLKTPPRENLSMTGEITLSGKVLPVGGVRQKCIAAIYQGIKHIIIPHDNLKDLQKIDEDLRKKVQFYPVKEIREVLSIAFPTIMEKHIPKF